MDQTVPKKCNHIEELITLVYPPSEQFHDFPACEITLAQKTPCDNGHQLDSMRFFRVIRGRCPGGFQTCGEQRYEERLLQGLKMRRPYAQHK